MIKKDDLLDLFERMARENWAYAWGAAREGCVDCSGAFVYAYRQLDSSVYIAHGSNSILRQSMGTLLPMSAARPGYAAVKVRAWDGEEIGNRWYGQEPGDCYHIGLVGRDGKILNAKGTGAGGRGGNVGRDARGAALAGSGYGHGGRGSDDQADNSAAGGAGLVAVRAWRYL